MMKRCFLLAGLLLWVQLLLPYAAHADTYELHTPSGKQIQAEGAVALACDFVKELTGVELTGFYSTEDNRYMEGKTEMYFGPGWQ